jgi:hypothetical protein
MKSKHILLIFLLITHTVFYAQRVQISGFIRDADSGEALMGQIYFVRHIILELAQIIAVTSVLLYQHPA